MSYVCHTCGDTHEGVPHLGCDQPDPYFNVPEEELGQRVFITSDLCVIDNEHFLIRGVIEIPVHGQEDPFGFGVWVSQKEENYQTYVDNFESGSIGPFFGWLSNQLSCYDEDTFCLKTVAHFRGDGQRPLIEVESTDHPLSVDQRNGISLERAWMLVHHYM